jgi:hypothetical protein
VSGATCCCCLLGKNAFLWAQKLSRKKKALRLQLFDEKMFKLVSQEKQMGVSRQASIVHIYRVESNWMHPCTKLWWCNNVY